MTDFYPRHLARKLDAMPRLLAVLAQFCGQLSNFSQIGGQLGLDSKTVQKYIGLLEQIFLVKPENRPLPNSLPVLQTILNKG